MRIKIVTLRSFWHSNLEPELVWSAIDFAEKEENIKMGNEIKVEAVYASSESAARIVILNAVYEIYKNPENKLFSGYLKIHKLETDQSFAKRTREVFQAIFGVDTVKQLADAYGTEALKPENLQQTTEDAFSKLHATPLAFNSKIFVQLEAVITDSISQSSLKSVRSQQFLQ